MPKKKKRELERKKKAEEELEALKHTEREKNREMMASILAQDFSKLSERVFDYSGNRWIQCKYCGKKSTEDEFSSYGGRGTVNLGTCKSCSEEGRDLMDLDAIKPINHTRKCPKCGNKLIERTGRYGNFYGCSGYPRCKYSERI